jgi:xanthine dehydrogenase accessory factor
MKEILQDLIVTLEQGRDAVFCGIVESSGSAPRTSGARMLVLPDGSIRGSVGGGAVEGACVAIAAKLLEGEESHRFLSFDMTATKAADAGMLCGGAVRILLQRVTPDQLQFFQRLDRLRSQGERPVLVTFMSGEESPILDVWSAREGLEGMNLPDALAEEFIRKAAKARQPFSLEEDDLRVFAEPVINPSVVHLVGAGHVALATAKVAAFAGFEVVVMDDRAEFASVERYPEAREVRVLESFEGCLSELGRDDCVVIATRGHMQDRNVVAQALRTNAGYVGMIGSRSKREAVYRSLLESGYTERDLARVHCPIGLSIGADTPEEIAVSIVAEMIRVRAGLPA